MKNLSKQTEITLYIPPKMWKEFREAIFKTRINHEEVIGFIFCKRHQVSKRKIRYIPTGWIVPTSDCYEHQSSNQLILKQSFHLHLLKTYLSQKGLSIVHIHTHAGQTKPNFSSIDDHYEAKYAKFLSSSLKTKPRLISGVFDETLQQSQFRIWDRKGQFFKEIKFCNSYLDLSKTQDLISHNQSMFSRQKIFGDFVQQQLNELTVALIGCGGIGSIFAELLGRLGVKKWILVDPDCLDVTNLNRMPAATPLMAQQQWYKVDYVKRTLKQIYQTGSCVTALPTSIEDKSIRGILASSDLIVVATDNHRSRQIAQQLALEYMRPLVCLGTHIEVRPNNSPQMYCRITIPPLGGQWCLMCGNIINLQKAALESAPQDIYHLASQRGYLEGINNPAVFWLNSICASTAVGIIHGMMSGFFNLDEGIDWIYHFPASNWLKTNLLSLATTECYFCSSNIR